MLDHLDYNKNSDEEKKKITLALIDLFKEIDVNGDGTFIIIINNSRNNGMGRVFEPHHRIRLVEE
jgi:hypothetical protein